MNGKHTKVLTISRVDRSGKYLELFFLEEKRYTDSLIAGNINLDSGEQFLLSCKSGDLWDAAEEAGLTNTVINRGFVGLKTLWEKDKFNWSLKCFCTDNTQEEPPGKEQILKDTLEDNGIIKGWVPACYRATLEAMEKYAVLLKSSGRDV